ncbi:penicillin-binding transpeptidase domain-containing protein [Pediococcus stilesii]|uniref:Cell division protein FtsI penicillin-binding protein 2 n=1 Tax=Pediococcus stilesii TaxID=331679 RepID=A0A0R2L3D6_9LACO|nr:penicillin-binding transpeptidase domain-containing protein [Pediococcus stilesii]KRN94012.1 cell division protein FtsI penicillin-binding protein 2 [Pediococcus stilesii]
MMNRKKRTTSTKETQHNRKMFGKWLLLIVLGVFIVIVGRFSYIAVSGTVESVNLSSQAKRLYTDNKTIKAKRGSILDTNGNPIAEDTSTYSIYAVLSKSQVGPNKKPLYVTNKEKTAKVLSKYLPISYKKALKTLNPSNSKTFQVEFGGAGNNISVSTKEKIEREKLSGINFVSSEARLYPNGTFASNLIGFAQQSKQKGTDSTQLSGVMGLEKMNNKKLSGTDGEQSLQKDKFGYQLPGSQVERPARDGSTIYTTIDQRLQTIMENVVGKVQSDTHSESMSATIMNAKTGAILATTQRPTFNSSTKKGLSKAWNNALVQDTFEPGSTMKVFTTAAAIDSGNFNANDTYESGTYEIDGKTIPDWKKEGWGVISYAKGFALSSNVAMAHLEQKMGAKTWKKYIDRFKLLKSTDSGLESESKGSIQFDYPIEQANTAFGQAVNVTAIQMLQGFTAIANNGQMVKPQFIKKVVNPNTGKTTFSMKTEKLGKPIKASTAKQVRGLMEDVVYKSYGIGSAFKLNGYKIAAKTGTAQVANSNGTGYLTGDNSYLYSVVGMAPSKNPKYIMYITMKKPKLKGDKTATELLDEIFGPVMKQALEQDKETSNSDINSSVEVPNLVGKDISDASKELGKNNVAVVTLGNGKKVTEQSETEGTKVLVGQRILLNTGGTITMPDLSGWSKNDVIKLTSMLNINVKYTGNGFVFDQSISKGSPIRSGTTMTVNLK